MALVGPGTDLYLKGTGQPDNQSIEFELEGNRTSDFALTTASSLASFTLPTGMRDFENYSSGSTIVYDFHNTITYLINNADEVDAYRELVFSGRVSGDIITLNVESNFYEQAGSVILNVHYSINSTSSWTLILNRSATDTYDLVYIPGVDYNDVVRVKINIFVSGISGEGDVTLTLVGGSFTSGSGTITASGTTTWYESVFVAP